MRIAGIDKEFPDDARKQLSGDGKVVKVTGADGKVLWSMPPTVLAEVKKSGPPIIVGKVLPQTVVEAISVILGNAQFQTLRTNEKVLVDYFHGYLAGAHTIIGIVCGALGYDLSWLKEKEDDDASNGSKSPSTVGKPTGTAHRT